MEKIPVTLTTHYKEKPAGPDIPFGVIMTDHMFLMNYDQEDASFPTLPSRSTPPAWCCTMRRKSSRA